MGCGDALPFSFLGQMSEEDDYFSLAGLTYSPYTPYLGAASNDSSTGNYAATLYRYNARGWQDIVTDPTGTINRTVDDGLGINRYPAPAWACLCAGT